MGKYLKSTDLCERLRVIEQAKVDAIKEIKSIYTQATDKLIEDDLSLQRGQVYRCREGGSVDYRGYFSGIKDGKIHLEICLADGTLTGRHFSMHWVRCLRCLEDVVLK